MDALNKRFSDYAKYYDLFYENKDYPDEALFIHNIIKRYHSKSADNISMLDIGCGTGIHALELMTHGYNIEGSDISSDMIELARNRSSNAGKDISFYNESFQTSHKINKKYDVVLALFSSINYVLSDEDINKSFQNMNSLLNDGGILIFDFWNGDAVIRDYSPARERSVVSDDIKITRKTSSSVSIGTHRITVDFDFELYRKDKIIEQFSEKHELRYFFIEEMKDMLLKSNFQLIHRCPFNEIDKTLDPFTWNVTFVAEKGGY